jgi:hypothetical protein
VFISPRGTSRRVDLDIADGEREPEVDPAPPEPAHADPTLPEPAFIESDVDPVVGGVEPNSTGSGGEYVGNRRIHPTATTRSGRQSRPPSDLKDYSR